MTMLKGFGLGFEINKQIDKEANKHKLINK